MLLVLHFMLRHPRVSYDVPLVLLLYCFELPSVLFDYIFLIRPKVSYGVSCRKLARTRTKN